MHFDAAGASFPAVGRSLTQVSVAAGSRSVTVADGSVFDANDVGKQISIPGATDMLTRITGFPNPPTIDPTAVRLEDHARATVEGLTIQLLGRKIHDGAMNVGSKRLNSATANFSLDDVQSGDLKIEGAGHHVTTITGTTAGGVQIQDPAVRGVANGTAAVWDPDADSLGGLLGLIEAVRGAGPGPHEIEFPPGLFDFTRPDTPPGGMNAVIGLEGFTDLTIRGASLGATVLRLMPEQPLKNDDGIVMDTHLLMARNCSGLTICDLSVDAAYLTMQLAVEQMHSVFISEGCTHTTIVDVGVVHSAGDAVRLLGEVGNTVEDVRVERCQLIRAKRSGVAVHRAVSKATIRDCTIEMSPPSTGSGLDFEPSGVASEDFVIESNMFVHHTGSPAVSLSGIKNGDATQRVRFIGNTVEGGGIGGVNCKVVTISDNVITAGPDNGLALDGFDDLTVSGNRITVEDPTRAGIALTRLPNVESHNVDIHDNMLLVPGPGIDISSGGDHIDVSSNRIQGSGTDTPFGIKVRLITAPVHRDVRITHNSVTNFTKSGIHLAAQAPDGGAVTVVGVDISSNYLHIDEPGSSVAGINLEGPATSPGWLQQVLISGNLIGANIGRKIRRGTLTIAIGGNPGEAAIYQGSVSPQALGLAAPPGSLFISTPGGTATARVYFKVSGTGATGWRQIHVLPWPFWRDLGPSPAGDPDQPVAGDRG